MAKRKRTEKTTRHCLSCKELKTDFFSNGLCTSCERVRVLIRIYIDNKEELVRSIEHDEVILRIKKDILSGVHPVTKKPLFRARRFACYILKDGQEIFFTELQGHNKKSALLTLPEVVRIYQNNTRAEDIHGTVYKLKGNGLS